MIGRDGPAPSPRGPRPPRGRLLRTLAGAALLAHGAALAQPGGMSLFTTDAKAPAVVRANAPSDAHAHRHRIARADTARLGALRDEVAAGGSGKLRLNLFADVEYVATLERSVPTATGYTLSGPLDGVPFGRVVLVVNDGKTYGRVYAPAGNWRIRTVGAMQTVERLASEPLRCGLEADLMANRRVEVGDDAVPRHRADHPRALGVAARVGKIEGLGVRSRHARGAGGGAAAWRDPRPAPPQRLGGFIAAEDDGNGAAEDDGTVVDVLVVYPSFARDFEGGYGPMLSLIDLDIATANAAYAASGVALRVNLAAAVEVEYDWFLDRALTAVSSGPFVETQHVHDALDHLAGREDGHLDEVHDLRSRYAADLVLLHLGGQKAALIASSLDVPLPLAGIAFAVHEVTTEVLERSAFSIARSGDGTVVAHELGHSMGLRHDRWFDTGNEPFPYSHGFVYEHAAVIPEHAAAIRDEPGETYPPMVFGTIMSPFSGAEYPGFVLAFSNPDLVHPEDPSLRLGVPGDEPSSAFDGPADATRHLNEVRTVVANVRARARADPCRYKVTGDRSDLPPAGGTYRVRVETEPDCAWRARGGEWVSSVSSREGKGSGEITYTVGRNDDFRRPVEVLVAGRLHARSQAGSKPATPVCARSLSVKSSLMRMHPDYVEQVNPPWSGGTPCHELRFDADYLASVSTFNSYPGDPRFIWRGLEVDEVRAGDFDGLTGLSTLWVNGFEDLPADAFAGLTGLRILDLSQEIEWEDDSAKLRSITPGAFRGLPGLRLLRINGHRLRRLEARMLEGLGALVSLDVSRARAGALTLGQGAFDGLRSLRLLTAVDNGMTEFGPGLVNGLTELRGLILVANRIGALPKGTLDGLSALRMLDLRINEIGAFPAGVFGGLSGLEDLLANGLQIATLEPGAFDGLGRLKRLFLNVNPLDDVPTAALSSLATLEALELRGNRFTAVESGAFGGLSRLQALALGGNRIARLDAGAFDGLPNLKALWMQQNGLRDISPGAFEGLGLLERLILSENALGTLPKGTFDGLDNLSHLWLDVSGITSLGAGLFEPTGRLIHVYLRGNRIRQLQRGAFLGVHLAQSVAMQANPGGPFTIAPTPVVAGARDGAPGQALEIALEIASSAPFDVRASLVASGGAVSTDELMVEAGALHSRRLATVTPEGDGPVTVRIEGQPHLVPSISYPDACGSGVLIGTSHRACYGGLRLASGPPLVLYGIEDRALQRGRGPETVDLTEVFAYFVGAAHYTALSNDESVAAVRVEDGTLTVTPGATGTAEVTVTAEGADGETLTRRFKVTVRVPSVPLFLSASNPAGEGFARVLNLSDEAGTVRVTAIDDAGTRHGPVRLRLRPYGAAQFNSTDLLEGNEAKRLLEGVGAGVGQGDWRLEFESDLDIEALSYVRAGDGFLAPVHDAAPLEGGSHRVATFNPADNPRQVSRLRVVNPDRESAEVTVRGIDDTGASPGGPVRFTVPAGASRTFDAMQLEGGDPDLDGALGDGEGRWRLTVASASPVVAMGLLENASTGHLANLSSGPVAPDAAGVRHVGLFPASDASGRRGLLRVINGSREAALVRIEAFDDAGAAYGLLELSVGPGAVAHIDSDDLEFGAAGKGLTGGTGAGDGDWRLELRSDQEIDVLAYVRSEDGFLTAMHDAVAVRDGRRRVSLFNPGSNARQQSRLRIANPLPEDVVVGVHGTDDFGSSPGLSAQYSVPAGAVVTMTAEGLEAGVPHEILEDYWIRWPLGDGHGKWRLSVATEPGVLVQSLLESPAGHLTNLSTAPAHGRALTR